MGTVCPFNRAAKTMTNTLSAPSPMTDRELEFVAIIASAELAFDRVYCARKDMAA